jgi:O-Antigen ligase
MTSANYEFLILQVVLGIAVYLLFFRTRDIPGMLKFLVVISYITMPVAIIIRGISSAIYLSDFILPVLLFYLLLNSSKIKALFRNRLVLILALLLLIVPFMSMSLLSIIWNKDPVGSRGWLEAGIWFYRNITLLLVFAVGISSKIKREQMRNFIYMNLVYAAILALLGLFNYFGPINMSTFETFVGGGVLPQSYTGSRIGLGFLGLFRGSVGQWFTVMVLLAIASYRFLPRRARAFVWILVTAGIGVLLLSYSRAGFIGLIAGLIVLCFAGIRRRGIQALFIALFALLLWFILWPNLFQTRYNFITFKPQEVQKLKLEAEESRLTAWNSGFQYLGRNMDSFLVGVGPSNREVVYDIVGKYGAHDEYLDAIFRAGILELILMLLFLILVFLSFIRQKSKVDENSIKLVIWGFIAILTANVVIAVTQVHLLHDYATYTFGFYIYMLYGVFLGVYWNSEEALTV